jgi:hypothetical protein
MSDGEQSTAPAPEGQQYEDQSYILLMVSLSTVISVFFSVFQIRACPCNPLKEP